MSSETKNSGFGALPRLLGRESLQMKIQKVLRAKRRVFSTETAVYVLLIACAGTLAIVLMMQIIHGLPAAVEALQTFNIVIEGVWL